MTCLCCLLAGLLLAAGALAEPLRVAVLPPEPHSLAVGVVHRVAERYQLPVDHLSPTEVVDPAVFSAHRYPVALVAGQERYLATVHQRGDAALALVRYVREGGTLLVGGFVWPFYRPVDWNGKTFQEAPIALDPGLVPDPAMQAELERMGQRLTGTFNYWLGLHVSGPGTRQFEAPEEAVSFRFLAGQTFALGDSDPVPWVIEGEQRFRPVAVTGLPDGAECQPVIELVGASGSYGAGAAVVRWQPGGAVVYIWHQLWLGDVGERLVKSALMLAGRQRLPVASQQEAAALGAEGEALVGRAEVVEQHTVGLPEASYLARSAAGLAARASRLGDLAVLGHDLAARAEAASLKAALARLEARVDWARTATR